MEQQLKYAQTKEPTLEQLIAMRPDITAEADKQLHDEYIGRHPEIAKASEDAVNKLRADQRFADNIDVLAGVHIGVNKVLRNSFNGMMSGIDALNQMTSENPAGETPMPRWNDPQAVSEENKLGNPGKVAKVITEVVTPMAASMMLPGAYSTVAKAATTDALYGFLAQTPEDPNLGNMLKDTWAENIPGVTAALDYVKTKPEDPEIVNRLRNAVVAGGFSAAVAQTIHGVFGISKFFAGKKLAQAPETIAALQKETSAIDEAVTKAGPAPAAPAPSAEAMPVMKDGADFSGVADKLKSVPESSVILKDGTKATLKAEMVTDAKAGHEGLAGQTDIPGVAAYNEAGERIGYVQVGGEKVNGEFKTTVTYVKVNPEMQQKGLATAMYDYADKNVAKISGPSQYQTPEGKAFTDKYYANKAEPKQMDLIPPEIGSPQEQQALAQKEMSYTSPDTPEEAAAFEQQAKVLELDTPIVQANAEGVPFFKVQDSGFLNTLAQIAKANPGRIQRLPLTHLQQSDVANQLLQNPKYVEDLLKNFKPNTILNETDTRLVQYLIQNTDTEWQKFLQALPEKGSTEQKIIFLQKRDGYLRMNDIIQTNGSNQGAALEAQKIAASIYNTTEKNGLSLMGAQGRAKLSTDFLLRHGGEISVEQQMQGMKLISQIPDNQFTYRMGEVQRISKFERIDNAITKVALNGMTSMSFKGAAVANSLATAQLSINKYVQALNPISKVTLEQANATSWGMITAIKDGLAEGYRVGKDAGNFVGRTQNLDYVVGAMNLTDKDVAIRSGLSSWQENGVLSIEKAADVLSAGGAPTKLLVGLDAASNHIVTTGLLRGEAIAAADANGILSHEREAFIANFLAKPPTDVANRVDKAARTISLSNAAEGWVGDIVEGIKEFPVIKDMPLRRVVFPFMNTSANALVMFADNSPLFVGSPNFIKTVKAFNAGAPNAAAELDLALTKAFTGTLALTAVASLAHEGVVSGGYKENPDLNKALSGNEFPDVTSMKINGKWVKLDNYGYISSLINVASSMNRASSYMTNDELAEAAGAITMAVAEGSNPLTQDISGLLSVIQGKSEAGKYLENLATRFTPMGSAMNETKSWVDQNKRTSMALDQVNDTLKAKFFGRIPGLSTGIGAERNFFGEVVKVPPGMIAGSIALFSPSDADAKDKLEKGTKIKNVMDNLMLYQDMHKEDPIPPLQIDFKKPWNKVPLVGFNNQRTGLTYEMNGAEYGAYQELAGGVDPATGKPYTDSFGSTMTLKDRFYATFEKHGIVNVPFAKITPKQYSDVVTELRAHTTRLKTEANNRIRGIKGVQENMDSQRLKGLQFKQQEGIN